MAPFLAADVAHEETTVLCWCWKGAVEADLVDMEGCSEHIRWKLSLQHGLYSVMAFIELFSCSRHCAEAFPCKALPCDGPYCVGAETEVRRIWGRPLSKRRTWALNVVPADSSAPPLPLALCSRACDRAHALGRFWLRVIHTSVSRQGPGVRRPGTSRRLSLDDFISFYFPLISNYSITGLDCFWNQK